MTWGLDGVENERGEKLRWSARTANMLGAQKPELHDFVRAVAALAIAGRRLRSNNRAWSLRRLQVRAEQAERATLHLGGVQPGVEDARAAFIRLSRYVSTVNRFRGVSDAASTDAGGEMSAVDFQQRHEEMCGAMEEYQATIHELESAIQYALNAAERLWRAQ